jgi:putative endonuclease
VEEWQVYLLKCADKSMYCGIAKDLHARIKVHNEGKGAKYTMGRRPVELLVASRKMTKSDALKCEIAIKKLPAKRKISALNKITH